MSSDSIDQLGQVDRFEFFNFHPILHTFSMWVVTRVWDHPGAVTLLQVLLLAGLLGFLARRLTQVGVAWWLTVVAAWSTAALPMVGATTITIWKDIPYSLAMVWAFAELIALARDRDRFWTSWWGPLRLGTALGLMWALRANGKVAVLIFAVALAIGFWRRWRTLLAAGGAIVAVGIVIPAVLLTVLSVNPGTIEPAEVFLPDVAAVVVNDPDWFSEADVARLEAIAPIEVWQSRYQCTDSTPLVFDPNFNHAPPRENPWSTGPWWCAPRSATCRRWPGIAGVPPRSSSFRGPLTAVTCIGRRLRSHRTLLVSPGTRSREGPIRSPLLNISGSRSPAWSGSHGVRRSSSSPASPPTSGLRFAGDCGLCCGGADSSGRSCSTWQL